MQIEATCTKVKTAVILLIGGLFITLSVTGNAKDNIKMISPEEISVKLLNLKDDLYFSCPDSKINEMESVLIKTFDFTGVAINGPKTIRQEKNEGFPVLAAFRNSVYRNYVSDRSQNCTLVVTDMVNEAVSCFPAFRVEKVPIKPSVDQKDPSLKTSFAAKVLLFDLKKVTDFEWHGGTYGISVISYDFGSNSISVGLEDKPLEAKPAVPDIYPEPNPLSGIRESGFLSGKKFKKVFPSYEPLDAVKPPKQAGVNFTIKPNKAGKNHPVLYGALMAPAKPLYLLKDTNQIELAEGIQRSVQAVVPMTVLIMCNNQSVPAYQINMGVPIYAERPIQPGEFLNGQFAVDLAEECSGALGKDKYVCYIVFGGILYGPESFEFSM